MTCLDDFIMEPVERMHLFTSIRDPAPIVTGAVEMNKRGWRSSHRAREAIPIA